MAENKQDVLVRAFATLLSLRKNIGEITYGVEEKYVREFHTVLDRVEDIDIDVSEFRIPDSEMRPRVTDKAPVSKYGKAVGMASYSKEKYVDKPFILTKLDAILGYFEFITSEKPKEIGFRKYKSGN